MSVFFCGIVFFCAMTKHSWPTAVTSWEDMLKFAQLLFGTDLRYQSYSDRVPVSSNESFLLFAKGACKSPRPFSEVACFERLAVSWIHLCFAAMAKNSWPIQESPCWDDTVKFARLLFGRDVQFDNYSHRLPHRSI